MAITCCRTGGDDLVLVMVNGALTPAEAMGEVSRAYDLAALHPARDRIVAIRPGARLGRFDLRALEALRELELARLSAAGGPEMNCAFTVPSRFHRPLLMLYKALWDVLALPGVAIHVTERLDDAFAALGRTRDRSRAA